MKKIVKHLLALDFLFSQSSLCQLISQLFRLMSRKIYLSPTWIGWRFELCSNLKRSLEAITPLLQNKTVSMWPSARVTSYNIHQFENVFPFCGSLYFKFYIQVVICLKRHNMHIIYAQQYWIIKDHSRQKYSSVFLSRPS